MMTVDFDVRSHWILWKPRRKNRNATYKCSACGKLCSSYYNDVGEWKFCPHCGARMKEEAKGFNFQKEETPQKHFTPEDVCKMSRKEVRDNYTAIIDSMKTWK